MRYLNIGCGSNFHKDWVNIDFVSSSEHVLQHDLRTGLPFEDNSFDVVYHSHVLEHLSKSEAYFFINECNRVLKKGGVIRVVVPDLEGIVREYLKNMELALQGDSIAENNYEWILLELYDQAVRNCSGGHMKEYLAKENIENEDYILSRIGDEAKKIIDDCRKARFIKIIDKPEYSTSLLSKVKDKLRYELKKMLFKKELSILEDINTYKVGEFRNSGEVHYWMYDRYSLSKLLKGAGFSMVKRVDAFQSMSSKFVEWNLDVLPNGEIRKPDSLFIEAVK